VILFEAESHIPGVAVIALLADRLEVDLVELCLDCHLLVARGASKVVDAPSLIEGGEYVSLDNLVAHLAQVPKQLVVVSLAVGKAFPLVVPITEEWLLALGADKVFNMPMLPKSSDHSFLNRPSASTADGNSHLVVAAKAVELVQLVGSVAGTRSHLPSRGCEFLFTASAREVVRMVNLPSEPQRVTIYDGVALLAHVLPLASRLHLRVAVVAKCSPLVLDETKVRQFLVAHLAAEAFWMPC